MVYGPHEADIRDRNLSIDSFIQGVVDRQFIQGVVDRQFIQGATQFIQGVVAKQFIQGVVATQFIQGVVAKQFIQGVVAKETRTEPSYLQEERPKWYVSTFTYTCLNN